MPIDTVEIIDNISLTDSSGTAIDATNPLAVAPHRPTPVSPVTLLASATLPPAGAYQGVPVHTDMVAIPALKAQALINVTYTRGASGGKAAHKFYVYDGGSVMQLVSPNNDFDGLEGPAPADGNPLSAAYEVRLAGYMTKIGIASAETGVTGTPGVAASTVSFD